MRPRVLDFACLGGGTLHDPDVKLAHDDFPVPRSLKEYTASWAAVDPSLLSAIAMT